MSKKVFVPDLCSANVKIYSSLEEANEVQGFVHPGDTCPTYMDALMFIKKHTEEDLQYQEATACTAHAWANRDRENLIKVKKEIRSLLTGRKNGTKR